MNCIMIFILSLSRNCGFTCRSAMDKYLIAVNVRCVAVGRDECEKRHNVV